MDITEEEAIMEAVIMEVTTEEAMPTIGGTVTEDIMAGITTAGDTITGDIMEVGMEAGEVSSGARLIPPTTTTLPYP